MHYVAPVLVRFKQYKHAQFTWWGGMNYMKDGVPKMLGPLRNSLLSCLLRNIHNRILFFIKKQNMLFTKAAR